MKTKQHDLLDHSSDLNELLAEIAEDTEIVITRGNTLIPRLLPTDVLIHTQSGEALMLQVKRGDNASPDALIRSPNLHSGAFVISNDFDEPLPSCVAGGVATGKRAS